MTEVLYIGGASRSGTTLVERLIGMLPRTQTLGEVRHMWSRGILANQLCGCGTAFHDCAFWRQVGEHAFGGWTSDLARGMDEIEARQDRSRRIPAMLLHHLRGTVPAEVAHYAQVYGQVYAAAGAVTGSKVVIDSSKHVSQPFALLADPGIRLRILQVVRDPRGVAFSWSKDVVRPEVTGTTTLMDRLSPPQVALDWDVQNGLFGLTRWAGIPRMVISYEALLADPAAAVAAVARFTGLELPDSVAEQLRDRTVVLQPAHSAAGNPMRFRTGPVELRVDRQWQRQLGRRERVMVSALTAPVAGAYRRRLELAAR